MTLLLKELLSISIKIQKTYIVFIKKKYIFFSIFLLYSDVLLLHINKIVVYKFIYSEFKFEKKDYYDENTIQHIVRK